VVHSHLAGDAFETERDDEIAQWLKHGYVREVRKSRRKITRRKASAR